MWSRRDFLSVVIATPILNHVDNICLKLKKWADMNTELLRATAYYRKTTRGLLEAPEKDDYNGWTRKMYIRFQGGSEATFWVDPYDHYLLGIEASGLLDISQLSGRPGTKIPLCYSKKNHWICRPNAQWGIGTRTNPLVPGRDFANSQWQFGTRITWGVPRQWLSTFRPVMYCADSFGDPNKPADRVDLFSGAEIDFKNPDIRAEVTIPQNAIGNVGISRSPVKGAQQCLNLLKIPGKNGLPLAEDDQFGAQTNSAFQTWLGKFRQKFAWGLPDHREPNDAEIYFLIRETAKEKNVAS
jgi:hypothetical protein